MKFQSVIFYLFCFAVLFACNDDASTTKKKATMDYSGVDVNTDSESEKFSYSVGMIVGNTLKNTGLDSVNYSIIDEAFEDSEEDQVVYSITAREVQTLLGEEVDLSKINEEIVKRAIYDVFEGDTTLLSLQEVSSSYQNFMQNNQSAVAEKNLEKGKTFLESNKNTEGVEVTDSGLQYQLVQAGNGETPGDNDVVEVWFSAETLAGKEFKEDVDQATSFVDLTDGTSDIPALAEAVKLFPAGSEFFLWIPSNLAFGETRISPDLGPNSTIKVHVSKTEIVDADTRNAYRQQKEEYLRRLQQQQQQQQR